MHSWCKYHSKIMGKYAGRTPNENAVRIEDSIPAIIDKKTWEDVQMRMNDKKHNASNKAKRDYLLSGLIECTACGASYVGHTSTNKRGYSTRYYCCGNKYRNHTCQSKNINANDLEEFVIKNLKLYLEQLDFGQMAQQIADEINGATADLKEERKELADIIFQLNNGTKAILKGIDYPELQEEMFKLRVRKSELEDIISRGEEKKPVDVEKIEKFLHESLDQIDENAKQVCKSLVKVYAHPNGNFDIEVGVHMYGNARHK